jgi:Bacterial Ig-like domain (group 1)
MFGFRMRSVSKTKVSVAAGCANGSAAVNRPDEFAPGSLGTWSRRLSQVVPLLLVAMMSATAVVGQVAVTTYHNDNSRNGINANETILTTANVNKNSFGKLFSRTVDGQVYGQPLYIPNVPIPGKGVHNVVYVVTMHDSVYAFDADSPNQSAPLWQVSMGTPPNNTNGVCGCLSIDIQGEVGILSTPVIDYASANVAASTLYVVAETAESGAVVFRLHALDITTGQDKLNSIVIQGSSNGIAFAPHQQWQRPGLLLLNGAVYIAFGSHQDTTPYHGWLYSYSYNSVASTWQQLGVLCLTCGGGSKAYEGGIWQGGVAPAADAAGNIYVETGNGGFDASNGNYGDSVVKINGSNLQVLDYFAPSTQAQDDTQDWDLGSSGPVLIPGTNLGLAGGKDGKMYVFNTTTGLLGQFHTPTDTIAQEWQATFSYNSSNAGGFWGGNYIFYNNTMYGFGERDALKAWSFNPNTLQFNTSAPTSSTSFLVPNSISDDPSLGISVNGTTPGSAVLWTTFSTSGSKQNGTAFPGVLQAYDATSVVAPIWVSDGDTNTARDTLGNWAKFAPPTVANGKVYVPTWGSASTLSGGLDVYGLFGDSSTAPVNLTTEGTADWIHWGDASLNRKAGVSPQISNYTVVGGGTPLTFPDDLRSLSWTDGAPTASNTGDTNGVYVGPLGQGFSFTAPADTTPRTLVVHVGGYLSGGTFTAHLSDGSSPDIIDTTPLVGPTVNSGKYDRNYTIPYAAASAGQTLTVTWVMSAGAGDGNVTLEAAALQGPSMNASAGTPQIAPVSTAFATALQATVTDSTGNPISGVSVTFTAPGTGPSGKFGASLTAIVTTNVSGIATAPVFTANTLAGPYTVTATASGYNSVIFSLSNTTGGASGTQASGGTPQTTPINTVFAAPLQATVTDTGGNPVSGTTVTFTAPTSAATATFSGSATASAITNASGVATAPALTANGVSGSYTVTASAGVGVPASFNLINIGAAGGALQGSGNSSSAAANLTTEGVVDWVHWGDGSTNSLNRKASVPAQLSNYTVVGTGGTLNTYNNDPRSLNWSDGTPTPTSTNNLAGIYIGTNNGFSFTAPADTVGRTLILHVGGYNSAGTLTAHLSDNSAPDFIDTTSITGNSYDRNYTLTYVSASAGQTLTVTWKMIAATGSGNVTLNAAALAGGSGSIAATGGTPQNTAVSTAFTTALQVMVTDSAGNPVNGAAVTFTAPASGPSATFGGSATATAVTNATGVATAPTLTANNQTGSYAVVASFLGAATPASFSLSNGTGSPASILASAGTLQSTPANTSFATALQATVKDAAGNPIGGLTVTFTAPSSGAGGAGGTFGGSATATGITNGSGVATAPALTANSQTGVFNVTATIAGLTANYSLTNTAALGVGSLQGIGDSSFAPVNLTAEGTVDWIHWGDSPGPNNDQATPAGLNRKAGVAPQLSDITQIGAGESYHSYPNDPRPISWTDGAPLLASTNNADGWYIHNVGKGFFFTAPADQASRILTVHVGGYNSGGTLTAHLSDGSTADYVDSTPYTNNPWDRNYTLTYNASQAGQTLTVSWVMSAGATDNVTISAAALRGGNGTVTATAGTPQTTAVNTAFATALQATVKDGGGNPVSGATVTFTASGTGATAAFSGAATATAATDVNGIATAPILTANSQIGSYNVTASVTGLGTVATFSLTNGIGAPSSILATAGNMQVTPAGGSFVTALQATVTDTGGNPISGATVTFTAPAGGANFSGVATANSVTNASGVATAPVLTASGQAGTYFVTASVAALNPASFMLTNTGPAGGSLQGGSDSLSTAANLTTEGAADWVHWGDNGTLNRKAAVIPQLSDYTSVSSGTVSIYPNDPRSLSWTDGNPTAANPTDTNGVYASGIGQGFVFTAPADTAVRTLTIHVGGLDSGGTLTAHMSDGSAPDYTDVMTSASGQYDRNYVINYVAKSAGQTLTVTWSMTSGISNVTLSGAALAGGNGSIIASAGTPQSANVNSAFATALQATVKDSGGNPINGATVMFTAPANGPSGSFGGSLTASSVTNASGIATAPSLTANLQTGSFTVTASVAGGGAPASFSLTNIAGALGLLQGSGDSSSAAVNLTAEGTSDWIHWGDSGTGTRPDGLGGLPNRKAGVSPQLSDYTPILVIPAPIGGYQNDSRLMSWTDGTPAATNTNDANGIFVHGCPINGGNEVCTTATPGDGFSFTAPADTATRVLMVHVGGFNSGGTLTAHLSDGSAADYVDVSPTIANVAYDRNYALTYHAGLPGQTLTVSWVISSGFSNVNMSGAALSGRGGSIVSSGGSGQSATVNTAFATALQATVTDSSSNPINGATVTFTAPANGASGTFAGSATASVLTNASGVATSPIFTANSQAGGFTVTATVPGAANPANFSLTNTGGAGGGSLQGTGNSATTAVNLTAEGTADWIHWGDNNGPNRKASVTPQLSTFTVVGSGTLNNYGNDPRPMSWADGTPTASITNNANGSFISNVGQGYSFTAPADTSQRTLIVHVGGYNSGGTLSAHLSDQSAADYVDVTSTVNGSYDRNYTINYTAASAGQTLTVKWVATSVANGGNVTLSAAALQGATGTVTATAGTPQSAAIGTTFVTDLQATVKDSQGNLVNGATVTFTAPPTGAGGAFSGSATATAVTNAGGIATAPDFTANNQVGGYTVVATVAGVPIPANFTLTNTVGSPATIVTTTGTPQSAAVGAAFATALQATVKDNGGNLISGATVTFTAPGTGATGTFAGSSTANVVTNASGVAMAPSLTAGTQAGPYTVAATVAGVVNPANFSLTNNPGSAASIATAAGTPQSSAINTAFATALKATVTDSGSNPVSGVTVTFTAPGSGSTGKFSGATTVNAVTNASGVATAPTFTAGTLAGTYTVTAKVTGVTNPANFSLTNTQGSPATIVTTAGTPQSSAISTAFATALQATVKDSGGNLVSGATVTFTAPATGATGNFSGSATATAVTNVSGVATAPTLTAGSQVGTYTVTAKVTGVANSANFSLTNTTAAPASVTTSAGTPQSAAINAAFATALKATVKDSGGNLVNGVTVTFTAPASGASGKFAGSLTATAVTNTSGVATAPTFTAGTQAGGYTVAATVAGVATPANFTLTNNIGPAASIVTTAGTPQSTATSTAFATALQATVTDSGGNLISGATVTFTAPGSAATAKFNGSATATAVTNSSGIATAPTLTASSQAGAYTVTAKVTGVANPANFSLTNTAGSAASIVTTAGTPQSIAINTAFVTALQATVKNSGGTAVGGATVTFTAPPSGASGTFGGSATANVVTNASGIAIAPAFTANGQAGSYTVTAAVSGVATPANFSLTNNVGPAASIVTAAGTPQSTATSAAFATALQATVKDSGGNLLTGITVTFTAPATTATATFSGSATATAVTNASGIATAPTLTANSQAGAYTVTAKVTGVANPANFSLTNTSGSAGSIVTTAGTPQSVTINTAFAALQATVKNSGGTAVSGATVTFTAPPSGASGTFGGSATANVVTNASGIATAPAFTANGQAGSYTVAATVSGVATPANFSLTNNVGPAASIVTAAGTPQVAVISTPFATALQATVKDNGGNLLSGVTVTFTAPASGATGTFSGSPTASAVTNASGLATAPTFTANSQSGGYPVTAAVTGVANPANFSLTNSGASGTSGSLQGASSILATAVNLTNEGSTDWVHWGDASLNRKTGVVAPLSLSSYTVVGTGGILNYGDDPRPINWTDGTPTVSGTSNTDGIYINSVGQGFSFTAPADTPLRTLVVHVGGYNSGGTLTAHLSDGSATDYVDVSTSVAGQYDRNYFLTYNAGSAGQTLTVTWTMTSGTGNVTLSAAALSGSIVSSAGTPQSATVNTAFATALQVTVKDIAGNPVNGATVTFTTPGSGAGATFGGSATATAVTNASGVATAPTLTANSLAGAYAVTATVPGVGGTANFSLTNTGSVSGGTLQGTGTSVTTAVNLTTEGAVDWIHWGDSGANTNANRKAGITPLLTTFTVVGSGTLNTYNNDPRRISWTGGTPTATGSNNGNGSYINGVGKGYSFTAPADTTSRTLVVHVGGYNSGGTLTAHLSDGSAVDYTDVTNSVSGQYDRNYTINYTAATAGQTLTITWKMTTGSGNVTLSGSALH